jgi:ATP-dependent Lhr-like helicase
MSPYFTAWLDALMQESDLEWIGCGKERLLFCFEPERTLFRRLDDREEDPSSLRPESEGVQSILPRAIGKHDFWDLADRSGRSSAEVAEDLWNLAWEGKMSNDSFSAVRSGIQNRFSVAEPSAPEPRSRRRGFRRWKSSRPMFGNWFAVMSDGDEIDALDEEEDNKDRVRQLLQRYPVLFREMLWNEIPRLQWASVFRSMRLMELSGELLSGHFFEGIPGLQFVSQESWRFLQKTLDTESVYWMNAVDPASLCGIGVDSLRSSLPHRQATTHLVFRGDRLMLVSRRMGKDLEFRTGPDDASISEYLSFFKDLLGRQFNPLRAICVETVNGQAVLDSSFRPALEEFGFVMDYRGLQLRKSYVG